MSFYCSSVYWEVKNESVVLVLPGSTDYKLGVEGFRAPGFFPCNTGGRPGVQEALCCNNQENQNEVSALSCEMT